MNFTAVRVYQYVSNLALDVFRDALEGLLIICSEIPVFVDTQHLLELK